MDHPVPLSVHALGKTFRQGAQEIAVLQDISFTVRPGEFLAVMGPSGSGKSTLLHVIGGLTEISSGRVEVAGIDIGGLSDARMTLLRRRQIGFVFQAFNLIPNLSVHDNIALPCLADGRRQLAGRISRLAESLGLSDKLGRLPGTLSGGEQQRVAIARALLPEPALILADEPTGSLDAASGEALCRLLQQLCLERHCTIVMVTHEPSVALYASRGLILRDGRRQGEFAIVPSMSVLELTGLYRSFLGGEACR